MKPRVSLFMLPPHWIKLPNLSGAYLKSYLRSKGIRDTSIYDVNIDSFRTLNIPARRYLALDRGLEEDLFSKIAASSPDVFNRIFSVVDRSDIIGFSLFGRNRAFSMRLYEDLSKRFPGKTFVFGGPETMKIEAALERAIPDTDNLFWVIGEGERPFYSICSGSAAEHHIRFREIEDLDTLPFLDFDDCDFNRYAKRMIPLLSSRGCTRQCNFCSETMLYRKFRHHSPAYVVDHIQYLRQKYAISTFSFQDSLFNYDLRVLEEFCSLLIEKNVKIQWEAQMRVRKDFSPALARMVKESGCLGIFVGLESAADGVLRAMNKGYTADDALVFFRTLNQARLYFEVSVIVGYPAETEDDFNETVRFVTKNRKHIPKIAQVNPFIMYNPSRIAEQFRENATLPQKVAPQALKRVRKLYRILTRNKIRHTASFINNLVYTEGH